MSVVIMFRQTESLLENGTMWFWSSSTARRPNSSCQDSALATALARASPARGLYIENPVSVSLMSVLASGVTRREA